MFSRNKRRKNVGGRPKYSIVVPVRNEEENIKSLIREMCYTLENNDIPHEIIVIDDASSDSTFTILEAILKEIPALTVVQSFSCGFGLAIRAGLEVVSGDFVAIVMGDYSDDLNDIIRYYEVLREGYDCAFGSRFIKGAKVQNYPFIKYIINRAANTLLRLIFIWGLNDYTNAFKAYRREVIDQIKPIISEQFNITIEIPIKAILHDFSYKQIPISWYGRKAGVSRFSIKEMKSHYLTTLLYLLNIKALSKGKLNFIQHKGKIQKESIEEHRKNNGLCNSAVPPM